MELLDDTQAGTGTLESFKEQTHGGLHLCIRVEDDAVLSIMYEADRQDLLEFPAAGTTQDAAAQPRLEYMQLRFAHRALQAKKQAVVEVRRVI
jgi:hypothetical protein